MPSWRFYVGKAKFGGRDMADFAALRCLLVAAMGVNIVPKDLVAKNVGGEAVAPLEAGKRRASVGVRGQRGC